MNKVEISDDLTVILLYDFSPTVFWNKQPNDLWSGNRVITHYSPWFSLSTVTHFFLGFQTQESGGNFSPASQRSLSTVQVKDLKTNNVSYVLSTNPWVPEWGNFSKWTSRYSKGPYHPQHVDSEVSPFRKRRFQPFKVTLALGSSLLWPIWVMVKNSS